MSCVHVKIGSNNDFLSISGARVRQLGACLKSFTHTAHKRNLSTSYRMTHCALQTQTASTKFSLQTNTFNSCPVFPLKSSMHPLSYILAFLIWFGCCTRDEFQCKVTIGSAFPYILNRMAATALHSLLKNIDVRELAMPIRKAGSVGFALNPYVPLRRSTECHRMLCAISCGAAESEDCSKVDCLVFECSWAQGEAFTAN